jgi:fructose-1,6-bisphosphatase/inositol monophosphatase family enzyme
VDDTALLAVLKATADAVRAALDRLDDWGLAGTRPGQYRSDLAADNAAVYVLTDAGLGVMSEESGDHYPDRPLVVVVDPLDGSTNASRGLPWYATSLCALDEEGPRAALVVNQFTGTRFEAVRGGGSWCDNRPLEPSGCRSVSDALVALNGYPPRHLGWNQYRSLGAAALDLCAVAAGTLDGFVDCTPGSLGPWDYLGALLICHEAGAVVVDAHGLPLVVRGHGDRRAVVAGASAELVEGLMAVRVTFP